MAAGVRFESQGLRCVTFTGCRPHAGQPTLSTSRCLNKYRDYDLSLISLTSRKADHKDRSRLELKPVAHQYSPSALASVNPSVLRPEAPNPTRSHSFAHSAVSMLAAAPSAFRG